MKRKVTQKKDSRRVRALKVITNLPSDLPILQQEIELIAAWWPTLATLMEDGQTALPDDPITHQHTTSRKPK